MPKLIHLIYTRLLHVRHANTRSIHTFVQGFLHLRTVSKIQSGLLCYSTEQSRGSLFQEDFRRCRAERRRSGGGFGRSKWSDTDRDVKILQLFVAGVKFGRLRRENVAKNNITEALIMSGCTINLNDIDAEV